MYNYIFHRTVNIISSVNYNSLTACHNKLRRIIPTILVSILFWDVFCLLAFRTKKSLLTMHNIYLTYCIDDLTNRNCLKMRPFETAQLVTKPVINWQ